MSGTEVAGLSPERRALLARLARGEAVAAALTQSEISRAGVDRYRPSRAQERIWLSDRLTDQPVFTIPYVSRLPPNIDETDMRKRIDRTVQRHDSLRTVFPETPDGPLAVVGSSTVPLDVLDLRHLPGDRARTRLDEIRREEALHRFDVTRDVLSRHTFVCVADDEKYLVSAMHHLVCDAQSLNGPFWRDMTGSTPKPLAIGYSDYAVWERSEERRDRLEREVEIWRQLLGDAPPPLRLFADRGRQARPSAAACTHEVRMDEQLVAEVRAAARTTGVTDFVFLLTALATVLAAWTGEQDVVVGSDVDGRVRPELNDIVGVFTNTLLLRVRMPSGEPFRAAVWATRNAVVDALSRQEAPYQDVMRALRPVWRLPESVELPISFNHFRMDAVRAETPHLTCQNELTIWAIDRGRSLDVQFFYRTALFEPETIELLARQFLETLRRACEDLDRPALPVPTQALIDAPLPPAGARTIPAAFAEVVRKAPDAPAVAGDFGVVSYGELAAEAARLTDLLRAAGVSPGSLVTVTTSRSPAAVASLLGVLGASCVYVPIPADTPEQRRDWLHADSGAVAALVERDGTVVLELIAEPGPPASSAEPLPESPGYCIYTSGSTGRPKGVVVGHDGAVAHVRSVAASLGIASDDRVLQFHGLGFDVSIEHILFALLHGAALVMRGDEPWAPRDFPRRVAEARVTIAALPTAYWHELTMLPPEAWQAYDLSALRVVVPGGEALSPEALASWHARAPRHVRLVNAYGPTEALMTATHAELPAGQPPRARAPLGPPLAGRSLAILDAALEPVPPGSVGELYIGGDLLAHGYHRAPGRTGAAFVPDSFSGRRGVRLYRTGDVVRLRADGSIEYVARTDAQVKLRGLRIEPEEIEESLRSHPSVAQAAVALVPAEDPYLSAWVAPHAGATLPSAADLRAFLAERLPAEMLPRAIVERVELPKTDGGKLDRRALVAEAALLVDSATGSSTAAEAAAFADELEAEVAAVFAAVLGVDAVAPDDNFFALGGHSLLAAQLATRLGDALGREVGLIDVMERPTAADLAALLRAAGGDESVERIQRRADDGDAVPLSPMQTALWFLSRITPTASYTVPLALQLDGDLDVERLESALRHLVEVHTALRTAILEIDGRPEGRLLPATLDLEPREVADDALVEELTALAAEPIDLAAGPLRVVLFRRGDARHILYLGVHHTACDGASFEVLLSQLAREYEAPGSTGEPALRYSDYAAWLAEHDTEWDAEIAFWRAHLEGVPALDLPTDRPRPGLVDFRGDHMFVPFPDGLSEQVAAFARERSTTVFTVLVAAWQALLSRWSEQDDFCVGVPVARRDRPDLREVVGPVLTTLPVRARLTGDPSFAELVDRTHATLVDCYANGGLPFERIVEELGGERDPSRTPLFQTLVSWEGRRAPAQAGPLVATPHEVGNRAAKTDLVLLLHETEAGLRGFLEYATALFDSPTAELIASALPRLLAAAVGAPATPVSALPLLESEDEEVLLHRRNEIARVESALTAHANVAAAAAVIRDGRVLAYVVPGAAGVDTAELRRELERALPDHLAPSVLVAVPALPLDADGRLVRAALPEPGASPAQPAEFVAPRTPAERILERIFAGALSIDAVGVHDDFFALGGHSLSAIEVSAYMKKIFQVDVPVTTIFETPTIDGLVGALEALAPSPDHIDRVAEIAEQVLMVDGR
jgi:amino acid adenylation domain-containing protein